MKTTWFKKIGWIYVPTSLIGAIITVIHIAFCVTVFIAIDKNSHSVTDTLYGIFPFFVCTGTVLFWIAGNTSEN
jgi:uncharacterized membrane protein